MKKRWLAVIGEKNMYVARVAVRKNQEMKVLFQSEYHLAVTEQQETSDIRSQEFENIKNWLLGLGVPIKKLKIAISSLGMITRVIALPQMSYQDLEKLISNHVDQYFTLNVADYIIDYRILDSYWEDQRKMNRVLLAAVPKQKMQFIWSLFNYLGVEPTVIDLTADCLARFYGSLTDKVQIIRSSDNELGSFPGDIAIVAVHGHKIELVLLENGIFFLYSDIELNVAAISEKLNQIIQKQMSQHPSLQNEMEENDMKETITLSCEVSIDKLEQEKIELEDTENEIEDKEILVNGQETDENSTDEDSYEDLYELTSELPIIDFSIEKNKSLEFMLQDLFVPREKLDKELPLLIEDIPEQQVMTIDDGNIFDPMDLSEALESLEENEIELLDKDPKEELEESLSPLLMTLSELLSFFAARHFGQNINSIYLTGEYCTLSHLPEILSDNLGVQTVAGFPKGWKPAFNIKGISQKQMDKWQCYGSLYGLALRED